MSTGLLRLFLQGTPLQNFNISPNVVGNDLIVEITEDQLRSMLLQNLDPRAKDSVTVELKEGKLILRIKLL